MNSCLIIDKGDEITSRINIVLDEFPMFHNIGKASNYDEAMCIILKRKPDIVFFNLDNVIDNSFQFVNELSTFLETVPSFVGVSSTEHLAYKSIKHSFIDYLVSPIPALELRKLFLKFKKKETNQQNRTLCLKSYKDYRYLNTEDILFLKADNNTTDFYLSDGKVVSGFKSLKAFENTLPNNFLRIHKSYIVNKNFVSRINHGKLRCTVDNSLHLLPFTKTYIDNIEFIKKSLSDISVSGIN